MTRVRIVALLILLSLLSFQSAAEVRQTEAAQGTGLIKTGNVTLDKSLALYSLGKATVAENLAVVAIVSSLPAEGRDKYLSLDEALQKKLLTVKEVSAGGSVPVLEVVSHADTPIFLPFGSIMTGGKQDRMLQEDALLPAKETRKISVYCVEQGRWQPSGSGAVFHSSKQMVGQSLKSLAAGERGQGAIWSKVSERNRALGNPSASGNIQGSQETETFNKLAKQYEPIRDGVAKESVCGALVILDGKVIGTEIFASEAYFKKIWPQLFNSYVVDAASKKETVKTDANKAKELAEAFLGKIMTAKVTEHSEKDVVRLTMQSDGGSGQALIEGQKGRLVYFRFFPKPDQAIPNMHWQGSLQQGAPQSYLHGYPSAGPAQAQVMPRSASHPTREITADNSAGSDAVTCSVELERSVLPANESRKVVAKVTLNATKPQAASDRSPVNLSIVLDRSGSMAGDKIVKAKEAAVEAVKRLTSKDVFSLVVYDHTIQTLIPAEHVKDVDVICAKTMSIEPGGRTALFGGLTRGAEEIRKSIEDKYVHRVILLSDGLANVGPSSPEELGRLGAALLKEGISVTTVGVGVDYNEDLMTRLSQKSDGNAYFVESSKDLPKIFAAELGDVLSVSAKKVSLLLECSEGVRPISIIGRDGRITGKKVEMSFNQLYAGQEKFALLELEIIGKAHNESFAVARAKVAFEDPLTGRPETVKGKADVRFSREMEAVEKSVRPSVTTAYEMTVNALTQEKAILLADKGKTREALEELNKSASRLRVLGGKYSDPRLLKKADEMAQGAKEIEARGWGQQSRKQLRTDSYQMMNQQQRFIEGPGAAVAPGGYR
jgi:Ca-activated chloride channel homolog